MANIVKRRKTAKYAQIHNNPLQNLTDLRSIGLLAHLMSLPEEWEIKKMQLYTKFGRGACTNAIKELEKERFWVSIKFRNGKLNEHIYHISDIPFDDGDVSEMILDVELQGFTVLSVSEPFNHLVSIVENQQLNNCASSIAENQQLKFNSSKSTVEKLHLLKEIGTKQTEIKEKGKKKHNNKVNNIVNKDDEKINEIIHKVTNEYRLKGLNKSLCIRVVNEVISKSKEVDDFEPYLRASFELVYKRVQIKLGNIPNPVAEHFGWNEENEVNIQDDDLPW